MRRRLWPRIALSLVLAAVLTLLTAWGPELWSLRPNWIPSYSDPQPLVQWPLYDKWRFETNHSLTSSHWYAVYMRYVGPLRSPTEEEKQAIEQAAPWWAVPETRTITADVRGASTTAYGLPLRFVRNHGVTYDTAESKSVNYWVVRIGDIYSNRLAGFAYGFMPLPTAINIAFWAFVSFWLLALPRLIRVLIRRARGRCIACGYDLAGTTNAPCPECGADHTKRPKSPKSAAIGSPAADPQ